MIRSPLHTVHDSNNARFDAVCVCACVCMRVCVLTSQILLSWSKEPVMIRSPLHIVHDSKNARFDAGCMYVLCVFLHVPNHAVVVKGLHDG